MAKKKENEVNLDGYNGVDINDLQVTAEDQANCGVAGLPNVLQQSASENQKVFDVFPKLVGAKLNGLIHYIKSKIALKKDIPKKTSELENDSGFITEKDVPVEAGEGAYSIVGKEDATAGKANRVIGRAGIAIGHKNKTYQKDSATFGGGNQAGFAEDKGGTVYRYEGTTNFPMTFPSFNDYYWDSATNTPKNGGKGKDAYGNILDSTGRTYLDSYGTVTVIGMSNVGLARASFTWGEESLNTAPWAVVGGRSNWNKEKGLYSDIGGYWNTNNGENNFMRGYKLNSYSETYKKDFNNCVLLGVGLYPSNDNCTMVGKYNNDKSNSQYELLFGVGGGTSEAARKNVLEVYSNGVVRVPKAPAYDHDVVNKAYLDKMLGVIENGSY